MRRDRNEREYLADGGPARAQPAGPHDSARGENSGDLCWGIVIVGGLVLALIVLASLASGSVG